MEFLFCHLTTLLTSILCDDTQKPTEADKTIKCKNTALLITANKRLAGKVADRMKNKLNMNAFKAGISSND